MQKTCDTSQRNAQKYDTTREREFCLNSRPTQAIYEIATTLESGKLSSRLVDRRGVVVDKPA